jgi:hypothetical protein
MTKFTPLIYNTEMVRAHIEGRKRQTRRTQGLGKINADPDDWQFECSEPCNNRWTFTQKSSLNEKSINDRTFNQIELKCPFGSPDDFLWFRETWKLTQPYDPETYYFSYKCDYWHSDRAASSKYDYSEPDIWRPSIHMPFEACLLFGQITHILVSRLQDISEHAAISEGVRKIADYGSTGYKHYQKPDCAFTDIDAVWSFETLWKSIYGEASWNKNPWVWVIHYKAKTRAEVESFIPTRFKTVKP